MSRRHAEIAGAGFAGLTAACALAQRGWSVRVHERADRLRTTGAGIYIYENGLRVLEAVGAYAAAVKSFRTDQAQALVRGTRRTCRRCRACAAAEYRPGRRLRHDERAFACGTSGTRGRHRNGPEILGTQRAPDHRTHPAHFLLARPADNLAAGASRRRAWPRRSLQMADRAAHPHCPAPADGDVSTRYCERSEAIQKRIQVIDCF